MKSVLVVAIAVLATLCAAAAPARGQSLEIAQGAGGAPVGGARAVSPTVETLAVHATVEEGVALVDIDQTFRNPTAAVLEGVWTIRLPEDAVVHTFSMWMEGREKQGRVLEARAARQVYDSIVRQRKDPALLEETGWRTFRVSVFPIPAKDTVRVRLRYAYVVPDDLGLHTLALPLPADGAEIAALDVAIDVKSSSGLAAFDAPGRADARIERTPTGGTLRWSAERTRATGPFVTRFAAGGEGFSLALLAHRDVAVTSGDGGDAVGDGREGHFLVRVVPHLATVPDLPRDVVFVVDRSGSMQGKKMDQARAALVNGIATLRAVDRFGIVSFASDVHSLGGDALVPASAEWLDRARADAAALDASGGTNISGALDAAQALRPADADPNRLFVVVLLTDGDPTVGETNPDAILRAWKARSGGRTRLFALGVGADVKDFLLSRLAEGSRGAAQYVAADADLEVKLSSLFERMRTPLLVDPEITVSGVVTRSVEPQPLPDVFRGGAVVLAGRYRVGGPAEIVLRGRSGGAPVELRFPVVFEKAPIARPHVAQIWARMRIDRLLDDLRASDGNRGAHAEIRQEIIDLGVRYQVVSPYTSFLVVEDGVHIPDSRELARVPDAPPASGPTADDRGQPTGSGAHALGRGSGGGRGSYRGPGGEVPPDSREPNDPPPVADGGGPGTPAGNDPGGPTTGGDGGGPPPSGGGGGAPSTGGGGNKIGGSTGPGYEAWTWWFDTSSDALLADRFARGTSRLDPAFVESKLLPALRTCAADPDQHFSIRAAAVEALARLRDDAPSTRDLIAALQRGERGAHRNVVERALLAPVWMDDRSEATRERLLGVVAGSPTRKSYERAFAAVSLGLIGERADGRVTQALLAAGQANAPDDLRPATFLALGFLGDRDAAAPLLARLVAPRSDLAETEEAWLIAALGRLADPGARDSSGRPAIAAQLRERLADGRASRVVRRAVPAALASIHTFAEELERARIVDALRAALGDEDRTVVHEALYALGRIAADPACTETRSLSIATRLLGFMDNTRARTSKDAARLALGLASRGAARKQVLAELRDVSYVKDGSSRGAAAAAWILAGDADAGAQCAAWAADTRLARDVRSRAAVAAAVLGSADAPSAIASLVGDLATAVAGPASFDAVAIARTGLDPALAVRALENVESPWLGHTLTRALGQVGGPADADRLLAIVGDEKQFPDFTRSLAVRALAGMADRRPNALARICDGFVYRAYVPALAELHWLVSGW